MGRAFVFGDNIDTDVLAPGQFMKLGTADLARHCLESLDPDFAASVKPGDILVAGRNFGMGSSREQAAISLKVLGISAVLAVSFARIFYRNAMNLGLACLNLAEAPTILPGDELAIDPLVGQVHNLTQSCDYCVEPIPPHLMLMLEDGGLIPHLKRRLTGHGGGVMT
jgi:3-isopropylmalate/(R)-2-methylmalate dehydratase small subunit